jgi:hypothetical protein
MDVFRNQKSLGCAPTRASNQGIAQRYKIRVKQKREGCLAFPLHDIPVTAALIHPWISTPLSKSDLRADARIKLIFVKRYSKRRKRNTHQLT